MANESLSKLRRLQADAQAMLEGEEEDGQAAAPSSRGNRFFRFCVRVHRSFAQNRGPVRAAALAYTTVLALVPLLAIAVSVSTSLLKKEGQEPIVQFIDSFVGYVAPALDLKTNVAPALDLKADTEGATDSTARDGVVNKKRVVSEITGFIRRFRSGTLGASGVLALIFVAISLLSTIEATFNDMWGARAGRSWTTRVASYWTALTLGPLFVLAALGMTGASQIQHTKAMLEQVELIRPVVHVIQMAAYMFLLPCLVLGLSLALLYLLMPNAKVDWRGAAVGGLVAALLLQANSALSVIYLSRVVTYRDIYGTLAAIPLFLLGLYISWIIVLLGGQVAYVYQTRNSYMDEKRAEKVNQQSRELTALRLMTCVGQHFQSGNQSPGAGRMADLLKIPERLGHQLLTVLVQNKLLVEVAGRPCGYSPARPLEEITVDDILRALRVGLGQETLANDDAAGRLIREQFESIREAEKQRASTVTIRDLVERTAQSSVSF